MGMPTWVKSLFRRQHSRKKLGYYAESAPSVVENVPRQDSTFFRDGRASRPDDIFIAIMGVTGSGKSSFISLCASAGKKAQIGNGLAACTSVVDVYAFEMSPARTVYLIDTPGFDDTERTDADILREIAGWLTSSYTNRIRLSGIIYLHRISDNRMQGSAKRNVLTFRKLCGENALAKVILVTTMWDTTPESEAVMREQQLRDTEDFWGYMVKKGSRTHRHNNTADGARAIIMELAGGDARITLDLQSQMVDRGLRLDQTSAGQELQSEMLKEKAKWTKELENLKQQTRQAIRERDREAAEAMREMLEDYQKKLARLEHAGGQLHASAQRLNEERIQKLERAMEEQQRSHQKELVKIQHEKNEMRAQMAKMRRENMMANLQRENSMTNMRRANSMANVRRENEEKAETRDGNNGREWPDAEEQSEPKQAPPWPLSVCITTPGVHLIGPKDSTGTSWSNCENAVYKTQGTKGTWVAKLSSGSWKLSGPMILEYPTLLDKINLKGKEDLQMVVLGPSQTWYAQWSDGHAYHLPRNASRCIKQLEGWRLKIFAVALGRDGSYLITHESKTGNGIINTKDLQGNYPVLERVLANSGGRGDILAITLNFVNSQEFIMISLKDGTAHAFWLLRKEETNQMLSGWAGIHGMEKHDMRP